MPLTQGAPFPPGALRRMAAAMVHRGPDDEAFVELPDIALASRRLSIVGLTDGRQPMCNEDRSIWVAFNGELFDFRRDTPGTRRARASVANALRHGDHRASLYEDHGEGFLEHMRGQFALALWDQRRGLLRSARDRIGICPLFWTRQRTPDGEYLLFASEIKALLASGVVHPTPDRRGLNHLFTFLALPGPITCFKGVQALASGPVPESAGGHISRRRGCLLGAGFSRPG